MLSQPVYELLHFDVPPHPSWKATKRSSGNTRAPTRVLSHVVIDGAGIWPVGFDGHDVEAMFFDEPLGNGCTSTIELGRAVAMSS